MTPTRRQFIRQLGTMLASLVLGGCCAPAAPGGGYISPRERLRSCWLGFSWVTEQGKGRSGEERDERLAQAARQMDRNHRAALDELVAAGELGSAAADQVQAAFGEATSHVVRTSSSMTCYKPTPLDNMYIDSKRRLIDQAKSLDEIAKSSEIDPCTIAQVQAAIEQEINFLTYPEQEIEAMYRETVETTDDIEPPIGAFDLPIDPATIEAARFLVELLSGESGFGDLPAQLATCLPPPSPTPLP
jgi:hypothetical protein